MQNESLHQHLYHNDDDTTHAEFRHKFGNEETQRLVKILEAHGIELSPHAKEYIFLPKEQLQIIIENCDKALIDNDQYIKNLETSDYSQDEKTQHINQAKQANYYLNIRRNIANVLLENK